MPQTFHQFYDQKIKANYGRSALCPCDSGQLSGECCLHNGRFQKAKSHCILGNHLPYSNPRCYATHLSGCGHTISGEHYISKSVLDQLANSGKVDIAGLAWQEKESSNFVGVSSLVGNVLCTKHNTALSALDNEAARFFSIIGRIDAEFHDIPPGSDFRLHLFSGDDIERWLLKIVCGMLAAKCVSGKWSANGEIKKEWIEILFGLRKWPPWWGLYLRANQGEVRYHSSSLDLNILCGPSGEVKALEAAIRGFPFILALGKFAVPQKVGIHRPRWVVLSRGDRHRVIEMSWADPSCQRFVQFNWADSYDGPSPHWPNWETRKIPRRRNRTRTLP